MGTNSSSLGQNSQEYSEEFGNQHIKLDFVNERGKFVTSGKVVELRNKLITFMEEHIYPMEIELYKHAMSSNRCIIHPAVENLKELAKTQGLWNLFIPLDSARRSQKLLYGENSQDVFGNRHGQPLGAGLSNIEYRHLCEIMGRSVWATHIFNCRAADTGKHGETVIIISSMEENGGPVSLWIQGANYLLPEL
ncbi:hypothetical protein RND81_14G141400 [Saponaria officinalis]|uniref:Uncharacterized protein n=1 Tax=Saponaria officinalis TaxID=3572 RepID=A0AAW1GQ55_SAPOF